jgi:hypothetical protein
LLGGLLYQRFGPETMFLTSSASALTGLALFGVTAFYLKRAAGRKAMRTEA